MAQTPDELYKLLKSSGYDLPDECTSFMIEADADGPVKFTATGYLDEKKDHLKFTHIAPPVESSGYAIEVPQHLTKDQMDRMSEEMDRANRTGKPMVLTGGAKLVPMPEPTPRPQTFRDYEITVVIVLALCWVTKMLIQANF